MMAQGRRALVPQEVLLFFFQESKVSTYKQMYIYMESNKGVFVEDIEEGMLSGTVIYSINNTEVSLKQNILLFRLVLEKYMYM